MKTANIKLCLALTAITAIISIASRPAKAQVNLAVWNFNDAVVNSTGGANEFSVDRAQPDVTATMSSNFVATNITNFTGSTINATNGDSAGQALALQGGAGTPSVNNGRNLTFTVTTTGYQSIIVSFATQRTATGFNSNQFQYSTDYSTNGGTFINFNAPYNPATSFALQTFDLSSIVGLNNDAHAAFRIIFNGVTSSSGNNRIDNLVVSGTVLPAASSSVPEPGSIALLIGLGISGTAILRFRVRR